MQKSKIGLNPRTIAIPNRICKISTDCYQFGSITETKNNESKPHTQDREQKTLTCVGFGQSPRQPRRRNRQEKTNKTITKHNKIETNKKNIHNHQSPRQNYVKANAKLTINRRKIARDGVERGSKFPPE